MLLTDNETKVDLLNNEAIAKTIITLLREKPDRPITVGIHGDWDAGKSSILEMIDAMLVDEKNVLCLEVQWVALSGLREREDRAARVHHFGNRRKAGPATSEKS
jgi:KAP family P-loop domain